MPDKRKYADRAEYLKQAVAKRRKRIKELLVEYKGGKCALCGYNKCIEGFDLHHLNRHRKEFGLGSDGLTRSWKRSKVEADKCILLCANCHREVHAGIVQLPRVIEVEKRGELRETYSK